MDIEDKVFKKTRPVAEKLISYGFVKDEGFLSYSTYICDRSFRVDLKVFESGKVEGRIYEVDIGQEYLTFRMTSATGGFVNKVRQEYIDVLNEIKGKCFLERYFESSQANRIADNIKERYGDAPVFPFKSYADYGVFKNPTTGKWYGLIMNIDRRKLDASDLDESIDVINVKVDDKRLDELIKTPGIFRAYHMNKKKWVTLVLDESLNDKAILDLIDQSHEYSKRK